MTTFLRVLDSDDKGAALLAAIHHPEAARGKQRFEVDPASFASVPRSPFAYWVSERLRRLFAELPPFAVDGRTAGVGIQTNDDCRFVRLFWETPLRGSDWCLMARGGRGTGFYADISTAVNWRCDGRELKVSIEQRYTSASRHIQKEALYHRPGITWPLRGVRFTASALPSGCIFSMAGKAAFAPRGQLPGLLAVFNSSAFDHLLCAHAGKVGGVQYESGLIQNVPVPSVEDNDLLGVLAGYACRAWALKRSLDTTTETSHAFTVPALLQRSVASGQWLVVRQILADTSLAEHSATWGDRVRAVEAEVAAIQVEIDERCFDLYGMEGADRRTISEGFRPGSSLVADDTEALGDTVGETEPDEPDNYGADAASLTAELVSWAVGVAFGRFDVRLATGARPLPPEPEPFDPLPVCSPGMLTDPDGLPVRSTPAGYPLRIAWEGALVDGPPSEGGVASDTDIVRRARDVIQLLWGDRAAEVEAEVCSLVRERDLRTYLRKPGGFFHHHLRAYSKSRRKAPIYWPLSTASGSYTLWLYYPRLSEDMLYRVLTEHLAPTVSDVAQRIAQLEREQGAAQGKQAAKHSKELAELTELQAELSELRQELQCVTALPYKPSLNDGVQICAAPLWRLFRHTQWKKRLQQTWKDLEAGKYDWAHLAYAVWPDRVREKCKTDRSLAIAHGCEELYQGEKRAGKTKKRNKMTSSDSSPAGFAEDGGDSAREEEGA